MSVTSRFPYALIQQLQKDVDALSRAVTDLWNQNTAAADDALILSLQNTINSVCAVLLAMKPMQTTCSCTPHSQIALWGH